MTWDLVISYAALGIAIVVVVTVERRILGAKRRLLELDALRGAATPTETEK